ncbi:hypothetical protein ACFWM0_18060 [Streptomyces sp. NPDC058405]|uniref:COG4315 family predicted lipoprotein n=1 Tax=Streptomyces sp. NPDC058405 TaxID=3346482 RepID=UPI00364E3990
MRSNTRTPAAATAAVVLLCATAVGGCSGGGSGSAATSQPPAGRADASASARSSSPAADVGKLSAATGSLGKILVNGEGRTLYLFEADKKNTSTCTGACVKTWPPLIVTGEPTAGSGGVKKSLLSTTTRDDGARQVTYNGHPLYTFVGDHKAGDTNGQGDTDFGANWYVLDTAGKKNTTPQQDTGGLY